MQVLKELNDFSAEEIEKEFKAFIEQEGLGFGAVLPNFRVLVTGLGMGPSMFRICNLLGKEETIRRIEAGLTKMNG